MKVAYRKYFLLLNKLKISDSLKLYNVLLIIIFYWLNLVHNSFYLNSKINVLFKNDASITTPVNELVQECILIKNEVKKLENRFGRNSLNPLYTFNPFNFEIYLQECGFITSPNIIDFIKIVSFNKNFRAPPLYVS
jgi:hypothetical protein